MGMAHVTARGKCALRALVLSSFNRIAKTYQSLRRVQVYLRIAH